MKTKINQLLSKWPKGTIGTSVWMESKGITADLRKSYKESGWIKAVANGAYTRFDDKANWQGALYAMQDQLQLPIHAGALTALELKGRSHFVPRSEKSRIYFFSRRNVTIPKWVGSLPDQERIQIFKTELFAGADEIGLSKHDCGEFDIKISSLERAIMEFLHLVPKTHSTYHARKLMETLTTLRPSLVQELLEGCRSIKVKRLFMALADELEHRWFVQLDKDKIDLGSGKRTIDPGGIYNAKYQITIAPEEHN